MVVLVLYDTGEVITVLCSAPAPAFGGELHHGGVPSQYAWDSVVPGAATAMKPILGHVNHDCQKCRFISPAAYSIPGHDVILKLLQGQRTAVVGCPATFGFSKIASGGHRGRWLVRRCACEM